MQSEEYKSFGILENTKKVAIADVQKSAKTYDDINVLLFAINEIAENIINVIIVI